MVLKGCAACMWILLLPAMLAQTAPQPFPPYLARDFDYASFTRFDAPAPPRNLIYQSNGFMALQEKGFGGQTIILPVAGNPVPTNSTDRVLAAVIDAPVFADSSGRSFDFAETPGKRHLTYYADRTVYHAAFDGGPEVTLTVYPVYGKSASVLRVRVDESAGPLRVSWSTHGSGFQLWGGDLAETISYGSSRWPYRLLFAPSPRAIVEKDTFHWKLKSGRDAAVIATLGEDQQKAAAALHEASASPDLFSSATHRAWNDYLASTPLVASAEPISFTIGTSRQKETIAPEDLVRSELWFWRGVLTNTCQVSYLPACPLTIADWNVFMGMWGNDGIAESISLAATGRKDLARAAILDWFRYSVNAKGDGTAAWTIFPSGKNTFQATGPERNTQSVPVQGSLVGQYVRLTGDTSILDVKPGGAAGERTVWQALVAYQKNLPKVRDSNHDRLIDWLHTYETGWDDKDSPFIDLKGHPTSAVNEQVFNLWSLREMAYLSRLRDDDPAPWLKEFAAARKAVRSKLWDPASQRYWDLDTSTGKLWTRGENLDAYFFLYFESDPSRIAAMMKRLNEPQKFNGALLPTLAFDAPHWGGYWRGPAWPRVFSYVALALDRAGERGEAFDWLARAIQSNLGPLLPENVDPQAYPPGEHAIGNVRIMGYDALDAMVFPDVVGLRTWAGEDLTVAPNFAAGKLYVRGQKWMGDNYDAVLEPGKPTLIWRNGQEMKPLSADHIWRAAREGENVIFRVVGSAAKRKRAAN
jgi:Mannosylglycerate hydrolase MGH1-like glycoside hydrolase domain